MRALRALRPVTWLAIFTVFSVFVVSPASPVAAAQGGAQLTINGTGTVRVDGATAATGATVFPGSRVTTAGGATAVVTSGGSRVTLNSDTDATVTYAGGMMRADVICGSAAGVPAPGTTFEMITHGDTNVFVQTGTVRVQAEGKTVDLETNQNQSFQGGVHIMSNGGSFEASTLLCSCLCAAPAVFAPIPGGFPLALLLLLIGGGAAAATVITTTTGGDDGSVVLSNPNP
jgi:hypothetical protein